MRELTENKMALFNLGSTLVTSGIGVVTTPIYTRLLSASEYGTVSVFMAWAQILVIFIGLESKGAIGPAKANLPESEQDSFQASILCLILCNAALFLTISLVAAVPISSLVELPVICAPLLVLQALSAALMAFFNARFTFNKNAQANFVVSSVTAVAAAVLSVALIVAAEQEDYRYLGRIVGFIVPSLLTGMILSTIFLARQHGSIKLKYWGLSLSLTIPIMLHGLSSVALSQIGRLGVQYAWGDSLVGIYSIALTVASFIGLLQSSSLNAFLPFMFDDMAGKTSDETKESHFRNYIFLFTALLSAFMFASPEILKLFAPSEYWSAIPVLPLLIVAHYFMFLYSFPANYEFFKMKTRTIGLGTLLAALVCLGLSFAMIPTFGIMGAAMSSAISNLMLFVFHFFVARYAYGDRNYPPRLLFGGLGFTCTITFVCLLLLDAVVARWILVAIFLAISILRVIAKRTIF